MKFKVLYTSDCGNVIALAGISKPKSNPLIDAWVWSAYMDSSCCALVTRQDEWPSCWTCLNFMQGQLEGYISSSGLLIIFMGKWWLAENRNSCSHISQVVSGSNTVKKRTDKGGTRGVAVCAFSLRQMAVPAVTSSLLRLERKMDGCFVIAMHLNLFARDLFLSYSQYI